ncbi:MAG: hypothetical protein M0Z81_10140 [Deltaproteobacteria bacterium]|nr:hypothetical protein [Deltaproteobacteria bacterium]
MSRRKVSMMILCEDRQQEVFARHYLIQCGVPRANIRTKICLGGSGEQYVREQYPVEVRAHRSKSSFLSVGLTVVTDADTLSVQDRLRNLDEELLASSQQGRQINERIGIFVPKRNIETWIHYLKGEIVNEEKSFMRNSSVKATANPLWRFSFNGV